MVFSPQDRTQALNRYYQITDELSQLFGEMAQVLQNETQAKSNAWVSTQHDSVTARDRYSTHAALNFTSEKYDIQSSINALEAERLYLDRFLQYVI